MKPQSAPPGSPRWVRPCAAPFPPPGPSRQVPRLRRYYGAVRLPVPLSLDSVAFAQPYPAAQLSFAPSGPGYPTAGQELISRSPSRQNTRGDKRGLPGSPTTLMSFCPVLRPRQDQHHQAIQCADMAPAMSTTKAPTIIQLSRLNHTASGLAVYASPGGWPHKTQNSLPAARQALPGGIGYPQGCAERFQCLKHLLLSGALPGARTFRIYLPVFGRKPDGKQWFRQSSIGLPRIPLPPKIRVMI